MSARRPSGPSDSHGVPWAGRRLGAQPFAGDTGAADPALAATLADHAEGRVGEADVVAALVIARVLVPVVAAVADGHPPPAEAPPPRADAGAQMSVPLLAGPDGSRALPAFTAVDTLAAWDAAARPVPVEACRAALAAVDEGCQVMVIDPGERWEFVVRRPALWALAQGRSWVPPAADPEIVDAVRAAVAGLEEVRSVRLDPGRGAELVVVLGLVQDLDAGRLHALLARVGERLRGLSLVAERAESVQLRPVPFTASGEFRGRRAGVPPEN